MSAVHHSVAFWREHDPCLWENYKFIKEKKTKKIDGVWKTVWVIIDMEVIHCRKPAAWTYGNILNDFNPVYCEKHGKILYDRTKRVYGAREARRDRKYKARIRKELEDACQSGQEVRTTPMENRGSIHGPGGRFVNKSKRCRNLSLET